MSERVQAITMPRWGMTMTEGNVAGWLVEEGTEVAADQDVVEIETTKITNVMEAGRAGLIRRIIVETGATVPVGALLAVMADPSVPDAEVDAFIAARKSEAHAEAGNVAPQSHIVEAGGARLNVLTLGEGGATPVVLLHGFGGDLNTWLFNHAALAEDRPVHAVDLPAHGGSDPVVGDHDVPALARAVAGILEALGVARAHLVGHSLGGAVALVMAAREMLPVVSLTLIAPAGFGDSVGENYIEAFLAADSRRDVKAALGKLFADPEAVSRDMISGVQRYKRLDGVSEALRSIADKVFPEGRHAEDLAPVLDRISVPVLLIWGVEDRILPLVGFAGAGPNIRVETLSAAGHMPMMEEAATVNRLIAEHVKMAEA